MFDGLAFEGLFSTSFCVPWAVITVDLELEIAIFQQEIKCLQKNYDDLGDKCMDAIANFTELESEVFHILFHLCP